MDLTGLFREWCFWWEIWLWKFWPFHFLFSSFNAARKRHGHKDSVGNQEGDCFRHLMSWLLFFSFLLVTIPYIIQTLFGQTTFLYVFLLLSSNLWSETFFFLFASLQSLIRNFLFFFCSSKHLHNLTVNETSFWERLLFFLSRARVKVLILGQGLWSKDWGFGSNGLGKVRRDICQGICLASGSRTKRMPHIYFHETHITMTIWKFMQNWSCMHPCGHSNIKFCGHVTLRLRIHFSYLKSTQCFQKMFIYQFRHTSESI